MTNEQNKRFQAIIHTAAGSCSAVGFASAQIPGSDCAIIAPIQVTMIISLGGVFGVSIDKSWAKSLLAANIATYTGRALSQALIGRVPRLGNVVNAGTAAALTETIGWKVAKDLGKSANTMNKAAAF